MKKSNTFGAFAEIVHYADILSSLKSESRTLSKNGQADNVRKLHDKINATNTIIFARLQTLLERDNFPVCGEYKARSYYVAKDGDSIIFSETAHEQGTYYYRWEWDDAYNELSVKDIEAFPIEFNAYTELLDEVLYLLAIMDCQKVLAKILTWAIYAESDRDSNDYRIKHILAQIPKEVRNQSAEGEYPINYKGLRLDYSVRADNWVIITRGEGEIKYANFFVGNA